MDTVTPGSAPLPAQHGPAWDATEDLAVIEAVGFALAAVGGGDRFLTPGAGLDALSGRVAAEGVVFDGAGAVLVAGEPNNCHGNVAALVADPSLVEPVEGGAVEGPVTQWWGWALSTDGMWREHSWGVDASGAAVETTAGRVRYFGVELAAAEAELVNPEPVELRSGAPVKLHVDFGEDSPFGNPGFSGESFWATPVDGGFRVDNVPFFAEGFTIGSVLSARQVGAGFEVTGVVSHEMAASGGVRFAETTPQEVASSAMEGLSALGCRFERPTTDLWVFAAPAGVGIDELAEVFSDAGCEWFFEPLPTPAGAAS